MSDKKQSQSCIISGILPCMGILFVVLLSAGCTGAFFGIQNTVPGTTVSPGTATSQTPNDCTFDQLTMNREVHLLAGDSCYFRAHTPMEYLNDLRMHPDQQVLVLNVPDDWITLHDAELLMKVIDSKEPAAPVVSPLSSYWPSNQTSTVGNEALFLLEGYRTGDYPPGLCSLNYFRPERAEVRGWWNTYGKLGLPDARNAIRIVQNTNPDLMAYPSDQFPTKSIRTEKAPDGWYVAFIQEGSGVPIISAQCYYVGNDKKVRPTGLVNHSIMVQLQDFSAQKCG